MRFGKCRLGEGELHLHKQGSLRGNLSGQDLQQWRPLHSFFLLPQSWSRLNEFHRPDSEFWLFLFFLSTFCTKPFIKATSIVIDWFLWFSICFLLE